MGAVAMLCTKNGNKVPEGLSGWCQWGSWVIGETPKARITAKVRGRSSLDEEKVPALGLYRITPADALEVSRGGGSVVVNLPNVLQQLSDTTKGAKLGGIAESLAAFVQHGPEG